MFVNMFAFYGFFRDSRSFVFARDYKNNEFSCILY